MQKHDTCIFTHEDNMGSRDGVVVRALTSHQRGLGLIPRPSVVCGMSLLLLLSPSLRVFSGFSGFPPSIKTITPNNNLIWNQWTNSHSVDLPLQIHIYLFYFIYVILTGEKITVAIGT